MGVVLSDDADRYVFNVSEVRTPLPLARGDKVDFVPQDGQATEIFVLRGTTGPTVSPAAPASGGGAFDLGRVIQRTFTAIRANAAIFFGASTLLVGVPSLVMGFGQASMVETSAVSSILLFFAGLLFYLVGTFMLQGMVVKTAVNSFNGKAMTPGEAMETAVRMFLPLLGLSIVAGIGTSLAFLLLIVPGIIVAIMWSVAAPAVVIEKRGVFESLQRSRDLTRGYRWHVFGLMVIYVILSWIIGAAVGGISLATGGSFMEGSAITWVNVVSSVIINVLSGVVASAGVGALYYELRTVKEGAGPEALAAIFD
ncbi:hypothetical protein [Brevundimonas diminuta]|uniref:hypothetical protein n=1 Tax=Brevundimonas diminuta TaxID=293 RepID=UPI003CFFA38C